MGGRGSSSGGGGWDKENTPQVGTLVAVEDLKIGSLGENETMERAIDSIQVDLMNKFPELKDGDLKLFVADNDNIYGFVKVDGTTVYMNKKMFSDKTIEKTYANDVKNGFHPKGTTAADVVAHEYGHVAHNLISQKYKTGSTFLGSKVTVKNDALTLLTTKAVNNVNKSTGIKLGIHDYAKNISGYANKNRHEMIAEAFSDVYANGKKATNISQEIVNLMRKELK